MFRGCLSAGLLCTGCMSFADTPPPPLPSTAPEVSFDGGNLSLKSEAATLRELLRAVAQQAALTFHLPSVLADREVTLTLEREPLDRALRRLLEGTSYVLVHESGEAGEARSPGRVAAIHVLTTGDLETIAPAAPSASRVLPAGAIGAGLDGDDPSAASDGLAPTGVATRSGAPTGIDVEESLRDADPKVRALGLRALRRHEETGAFPESLVAEVALNDEVRKLRRTALDLLEERGSPEVAAGTLVEVSEHDPDKQTRKRARKKLKRLENKKR